MKYSAEEFSITAADVPKTTKTRTSPFIGLLESFLESPDESVKVNYPVSMKAQSIAMSLRTDIKEMALGIKVSQRTLKSGESAIYLSKVL